MQQRRDSSAKISEGEEQQKVDVQAEAISGTHKSLLPILVISDTRQMKKYCEATEERSQHFFSLARVFESATQVKER